MRGCWIFEGVGGFLGDPSERQRQYSVASSFGLCSGFRQSGGRCAAAAFGPTGVGPFGFWVLLRDYGASLKESGSRFARWPTLATMKPSRRWGTRPQFRCGPPAYSKREMAIRRSSARRRYSSCTVRSARSWSVVCNGSEAISSSIASMSVATDASFSFKRSEGACDMANSLPPEGVGIDCYGLMRVLEEKGSRFARWQPDLDVGHPALLNTTNQL
jgi:hypothetical protein